MTMATPTRSNIRPRYLLDTNICIYAMNRNIGVLRHFKQHGMDAMAISSLVLGELAYGVAKRKTPLPYGVFKPDLPCFHGTKLPCGTTAKISIA